MAICQEREDFSTQMQVCSLGSRRPVALFSTLEYESVLGRLVICRSAGVGIQWRSAKAFAGNVEARKSHRVEVMTAVL